MCTQARVRKEQFRLLQGENLIRVYGKGEGAVKAFCVNCGSTLFGGDWPEGDEVSIRMGTFDDDPGIRPQYHTFVEDRAAWDEITDNLSQYPFALGEYARPFSGHVESGTGEIENLASRPSSAALQPRLRSE